MSYEPYFLKMTMDAVYNCPYEYKSETYPYKKYMNNLRLNHQLPYDFLDAPQHETEHDLSLRNKINAGDKVFRMDAVYMKPLDHPVNYAMTPFVGKKGKYLHELKPNFQSAGNGHELEYFPIADAVFLGGKEYINENDFSMLLELKRGPMNERKRKRVERMNVKAEDRKIQHHDSIAVKEVDICQSLSNYNVKLFGSTHTFDVKPVSTDASIPLE